MPPYGAFLLTWIIFSVMRSASGSSNVPHEASEETDTAARRLSSADVNDAAFAKKLADHLPLFQHSDEVQVMGPSIFPKPPDYHKKHADDDIVTNLQPVSGTHRPDQDVVMAFAAEYTLKNYVVFIESLRDTGFEGDVVLAVHELDLRQDDIREYLFQAPNVVIYAPKQACFNAEMEAVESVKGGMRICQCHDLYGRRENDGTITALDDPRPARTIAVTRYELYWIFSRNYNPEQWILLVDARDTYFQTNPFADVPRKTDATLESGLLYFFGENVDATRLGKSKQNSKWLLNAYGKEVANALSDKPTICSGATMGEQVAVSEYLRAMVAESDETKTVLMGADQGFHNFLYYRFVNIVLLSNVIDVCRNSQSVAEPLRGNCSEARDDVHGAFAFRYVCARSRLHIVGFFFSFSHVYVSITTTFFHYSHKLSNANRIHDIVVFDQGTGIVNNMGAMRTAPLEEWGNGRMVQDSEGHLTHVLNWDGTVSPVVHQFDRHKSLAKYFFITRGRIYTEKWETKRKILSISGGRSYMQKWETKRQDLDAATPE
jgi:hypothetical protein